MRSTGGRGVANTITKPLDCPTCDAKALQRGIQLGEPAVARMQRVYSRFLGGIGSILLGRGPTVRVSFFAAILTASLCVALVSFVSPMIWGVSERSLFLSYMASVVWLILVSLMIVRVRIRSIWALAGLPFAAYWPVVGTLLYLACSWGRDCI